MPNTSTAAAVLRAKSPLEAMVALAGALDQISSRLAELESASAASGWGDWPGGARSEDPTDAPVADTEFSWPPTEERRTEIVQDGEDHAEVVIPKPSFEKMEARRAFERQHLRLNEALTTPDGDPDMWNEAYAKGGPMWLYLANRDLLITYPRDTLAAMVRDVEEDSPQDAAEMGRDVLKFAGESGPGSIAMGTDVPPKGAKPIWSQ